MAESAVLYVIKELTSFVKSELELSKSVRSGVESLTRELSSIHVFLKDAESRAEYDDGVKEWVAQVRSMASRIEDILDNYLVVMRPKHHRDGFDRFKDKVTRPFTHHARRELADSIADALREIEDVSKRKDRYNFNSMRMINNDGSSSSSSSGVNNQQQDVRLTSLYLEDSEVVGFDRPKSDLVGLLNLEDNGARRSVISIVGMGGLGKSTLVRKIYDDETVRNVFPHRAWISVSQSWDRADLYQRTLRQLYKEAGRAGHTAIAPVGPKDELLIISELISYLEDKRYMIVFDDVWDANLWRFLKLALPDAGNGSKVVMTTRNGSVAAAWKESNRDFVYDLKPLKTEDAWELFCKNAFQIDCDGKCPQLLETLSRDIVEKCEGLPLAIVAVGRLLSNRDKVVGEWKTLNDNFGYELGRSLTDLNQIFLLSYQDLPSYLKPCFLYFAIFPEDYQILRMRIIRLWIAEGFVRTKCGNLTLEQVAEQYLIDLVSRNLIQVSDRDFTNRPKAFRVHDLYREWLLSKSEELGFCLVNQHNHETDGKMRRVSIQSDEVEYTPESIISMHPSARSLFVFRAEATKEMSLTRSLLASARLLRVIDLQDAPVKSIPDEIGDLFHLRYLSLRNTRVETLPSSVGKLQNLQTLDLRMSLVRKLPAQVKKLRHLRHLHSYLWSGELHVDGLIIPDGVLVCLKDLQKLADIELTNRSALIDELKNLKHLRKLGIIELKAKDGQALCNVVETMIQLETFNVGVFKNKNEILDLQHINTPPPYLKRVCLNGRMERLPQWIEKLSNLEKLSLAHSKFEEDPLEVLQMLPSLMFLVLWDTHMSKAASFGTRSFKKLKFLYLRDLHNLESMIIEEGAAPALEQLYVESCLHLKGIPSGFQHLGNLKTLYFIDLPREVMLSAKPDVGFNYQYVQHIPIVRYLDKDRETGKLKFYQWW